MGIILLTVAAIVFAAMHYLKGQIETTQQTNPVDPLEGYVEITPAEYRTKRAPKPANDTYRHQLADSAIEFALSLIGSPYVWAGREPSGFDCSGFTHFVYAHVGVYVCPASAGLDTVGIEIPLEEADKGDLIVFTGTNAADRSPGHVGMVISDANADTVSFIHSSSARDVSGVKISQVQGTGYAKRFLSIRRVLPESPIIKSAE